MKRVLVTAGIIGLIFIFSSQTYEQQSLVPILRKLFPGEPLSGLISGIKLSYWGMEISVEAKGYYYFLEFFIRKFAHLFLFGCLAVALYSVITLTKAKRPALLAFLGTTGYAVFDEFHQMLTGGRTPLVNDVFLDMFGAVIGLLIFIPIYKRRNHAVRQSNKASEHS